MAIAEVAHHARIFGIEQTDPCGGFVLGFVVED
jgi:hypothetical protein